VPPVITAIRPSWSVPGGRVELTGEDFPQHSGGPPRLLAGNDEVHVVASSRRRVRFIVPAAVTRGRVAVRFADAPSASVPLVIGHTVASGIHQVDNPAFDAYGQLYVTHSGTRGNKVPVPLYRIGPDGTREPLAVEVGNPTSLALGPDRTLYISSRFDGHVYRLVRDDHADLFATELGVATGLAFGPDGSLYVGDRAGTILRVSSNRHVETFATLPASVAAFHLAFGPGGDLFVSAPTLATHDPIYRITPDRMVDTVYDGFGRPQGLAFDSTGVLYVAEALAGAAGLYKLDLSRTPVTAELILSAAALIGVAFDPSGGVIVASNDTVWRIDADLKPAAILRSPGHPWPV
jgi:sugar lactone lactonase YvrE